jgi:hypothetical protein
MTKRIRKKGQTTIYKTLERKLKIEVVHIDPLVVAFYFSEM